MTDGETAQVRSGAAPGSGAVAGVDGGGVAGGIASGDGPVVAGDGPYVSVEPPGHLLTQLLMRRVDDPELGPSLEVDLRPEVVNPHGSLHGGLMTTLIECGASGHVVQAIGSENIVASDLLVRFLGPVRVGPARVVSKVLRQGRRNVVVQADVIDVGDDRRLVATATLSYARLADPGR